MMSPDEIRLKIMKGESKYIPSESKELPTGKEMAKMFKISEGIKNTENNIKTQEEKIKEAREMLLYSYENIVYFLDKWIDIPQDYKKIISIWIIGTYFHKKLTTYPYLFFNAMRGSGKTRLLKIISWLQANGNGNILNNPSEPVMFRTASERGLIFDEFESEKSKEKQTMREYLNSCYKKGGVVFRMEKQRVDGKERQVAMGYNLFTPIAMANINGIEDVLSDRAITLILEKSMNFALVKKIEDFDENLDIKCIKRTLTAFSVELCSVELPSECIVGWNRYVDSKYADLNAESNTLLHTTHTTHYYTQLDTNSSFIKGGEGELNELLKPKKSIDLTEEDLKTFNKIDSTGIFGRNLELFLPLLIVAKLIDDNVFEEILEIVKKLNMVKKDDEYLESKDVSLIEFVSLAERYRFEYVFVHQLLKEFKEFIGVHGEEEDRWITTNWLGLALKRLKLFTDKKRVAKGNLVLLTVDKAKERLRMFKNEDKEFNKP
jgi:hypothetical protein